MTAISKWCRQETIEYKFWTTDQAIGDDWQHGVASGHDWCQSQRWHDEYHGKDPGCCASEDERASWACECPCHIGKGGAW